ncbi:MAG: DUF86 domain-containing protein [Gammaproteobacteria bacterium]|nr:DUF86 domain-containing protein [Gammaproteobacteria bacterium]
MSKDAKLYLIHILESLEKINEYTKHGKPCFLKNIMAQDAVYRNFEIIGEATKRLPENIKALDNSIPWKHMAKFRDFIIHQYDGVDPTKVWKTIKENLPGLDHSIQNLLNQLEQT